MKIEQTKKVIDIATRNMEEQAAKNIRGLVSGMRKNLISFLT